MMHNEDGEEDNFGSVAWDTRATTPPADVTQYPSSNSNSNEPVSVVAATSLQEPDPLSVPKPRIVVKVSDPNRELEGTKDMFVSYLVSAITDLPSFSSKTPSSRRRFQDFTFLREHLTKDYPACVVPPLPDKHRMEYLTGDRFSNDFLERRRIDLSRFVERVARHPKLSRTDLFRNFIESTEWNVYKHKHLAHPIDHEHPTGILDNISDTLLNAFAKLRKPDERFIEIRHQLDQFEEGLTSIERLGSRSKTRLSDLSGDYDDLAQSFQGLGYLESGITDSLSRFERSLVEFGQEIKENSGMTTDPFLEHLHSLLAYSTAFKGVLKLRDQKQLDFEELSSYLSNVVSERDRLAGGYGYGMGIGSYLKEKVESLRGSETDGSREGKIARLDVKIKELQEAVIASQDTSQSFNEEVLKEQSVFQLAKRSEMKELLGSYAQGQIDMYKATITTWDKTISRIPLEP